MTEAERRLLAGAARDLGVPLTSDHLDSLEIYLEELCAWNRKMNMTGLKSRERMIVELIADSLVPVPFIPEKGLYLDVGTGPGIPGIPIKVLRPGLVTELLEPRARMNTFLRHVIRQAGLSGIRPVRGRIEKDPNLLRPGGYSLITSRAVAGLAKVLDWCAPYLAPGGVFAGFAGRDADAELERAQGVMERESLRVERDLPYDLPGVKGPRRALLFRKLRSVPSC